MRGPQYPTVDATKALRESGANGVNLLLPEGMQLTVDLRTGRMYYGPATGTKHNPAVGRIPAGS